MARLIGARKVPTTSDGGGVWTLNDQAKFKKDGIWPIYVDPNARYWRFLQTSPSWNTGAGSYHAAIYEFELFGSTDASGSALAGSSFAASSEYSASFLASYAGDGSLATYWSSLSGQPTAHWWSVDFGSAQRVKSVKIHPYTGGYYAQNYDLQFSSDNSNWTKLATLTTASGDGVQTFTSLQ